MKKMGEFSGVALFKRGIGSEETESQTCRKKNFS
jgi:hypothetical protein